MQQFSSFPGAPPFTVLHNRKNRCVGFTETFQTNSPLCWGNYGKFLPQVHALKKEAWAKQVVVAPPTCSSGLCLPLGVCWCVGMQANFTARVFSADLQPAEGQRVVRKKKNLKRIFTKQSAWIDRWNLLNWKLDTFYKIASFKGWIWKNISKIKQVNSRTGISSDNISKLNIT